MAGGFTYVDTVFPSTDATFEIAPFSDAECSNDVTVILATANLREDKIFNPSPLAWWQTGVPVRMP